ncbi:MAG: hypothetical protein IJZ61_03065 [Oscillospiraceae bacterium]|nr:hypothetical protein [Oscillospiraceae bacterium]
MKNVTELKESVGSRMKKCWGESCAFFFISVGGIAVAAFAWYLTADFLLTMGIIDSYTNSFLIIITFIILLLLWVITVPYKYGLRWYRLHQVRGHSVHGKSVFSCYFSAKRMFQVYKLSILLFLKRSVLLVPLAAIIGTEIYLITSFGSNNSSLGYNLVVVVLLMLSVVLYIAYNVINIKYAIAPYIFALGFDRPATEIIAESVRFTKEKRGYMVEVLRNCAFMLIPCVFIFPIIFVIPKMMMIYTAAINEIIENGFAEDKLAVTERRG